MAIERHFEILARDLRYAVRGLMRTPLFTSVAIVALALGIGAGTAVFSVVDRILFRSLPYPQADRLVSFGMVAPIVPQEFMLGYDYWDWRDSQTPFESVGSWTFGVRDCDLNDTAPLRLECARVDSTLLRTLGTEPVLGRDFTRDEERPNAPKTALISNGLWRSRFGQDPAIVGKPIRLDGQSVTIVGVLPPQFELPTLERVDILVPQVLDEPDQRARKLAIVLVCVGRLKPGIGPAQAAAALHPLFNKSLEAVTASFRKDVSLRVRPLRDRQVQDARLASWVLLGSVLAVLLIACANVANLLLARAATRERELAVRAALGAGRGRLFRQALTESTLLALAGGAAGCALAFGLLRFFVAIAPEGIPRLHQAGVDLRVLTFTLLLSLVCGVLFGLAPALESPRAETLRAGRSLGDGASPVPPMAGGHAALRLAGPAGGRRPSAAQPLESREPAARHAAGKHASGRSDAGTHAVPGARAAAGFLRGNGAALAPHPWSRGSGYRRVAAAHGQRHGVHAVRRHRGARPAAIHRTEPAAWSCTARSRRAIFPCSAFPSCKAGRSRRRIAIPNRNVVILSDALARRMFPGENPLGKQIRPGLRGEWLTVVGVAGNVKNSGLIEKENPEYYVLRKHSPENVAAGATAIMRTRIRPQAMAQWVRAEIAALDATLPVNIETMEQRVGKLAERPRFNAVLLGIFAGLGMLLAAIGLYGVISFLVAQRSQEIGVRMALGATPRAISRLVLGQAASWIAAGAVLGGVGSFFTVRLLGHMLFHVSATDPWTLAAALLMLLGVGLMAAWIPSRRAAHVDPMRVLREQ